MSFQSSQTQTAAKLLAGANTALRVPITICELPLSTANQFRYLAEGPSSAANTAIADFGHCAFASSCTTRSIAARSGTAMTMLLPALAIAVAYCANNVAGLSAPVVTMARGCSPANVRLIKASPPA